MNRSCFALSVFAFSIFFGITSSCKTVQTLDSEAAESPEAIEFKKGNTVAMTPVQNQGTVNYCWAYGMLGMVEGLHKKRTQEDVVLSPHALGFYHYVSIIKANLSKGLSEQEFFSLLNQTHMQQLDTSSPMDVAGSASPQRLLATYGTVPETAFKLRVETPEQAANLAQGIAKRMFEWTKKNGGEKLNSLSEDDIIKHFMIGKASGEYTAAPPKSFTYKGKTYTPLSFLKDYLKFDPQQIQTKGFPGNLIHVKGTYAELSLKQFIDEVNANLKAGISMPIAVGVDVSRLVGGTFQAEGKAPFQRAGGHIMLIVGPVKKPINAANDKDYIIVKNSYGIGEKSTSDGLYLIEIGYLKAQAAAPDTIAPLFSGPKTAGKVPSL